MRREFLAATILITAAQGSQPSPHFVRHSPKRPHDSRCGDLSGKKDRHACRFRRASFDYLMQGGRIEHSTSPVFKRRTTAVKMNTYVNFAGNCAEAFRFYEQHLGGKIGMMMTHADAPDQTHVDPEWKDAILHARVTIGGVDLMGADIPNAQPLRSAYLTLQVESDAEAERIFQALSEGGRILMAMQETFFATRFGQVQDRFGMNWMVLHERPRPDQA